MIKTPIIETTNLKAWVIFCKNTDLWFLKFLKKGFKHCFIILNDGKSWITYDPMSNITEITVHRTPLSFNLPEWFSQQEHKVISTIIERKHKIAPISLFTCVEGVKRVLGIHNFWILTPYQLYKHLQERNY